MQVKALVSFVSNLNGKKYRVQAGDELELPKGADWLAAGLVEALDQPSPKGRGGKSK
jgi:hypothetical protein